MMLPNEGLRGLIFILNLNHVETFSQNSSSSSEDEFASSNLHSYGRGSV